MNCWNCKKDTMKEVRSGIYQCECGATDVKVPSEKAHPTSKVTHIHSGTKNGTLSLILTPELKRRLEIAAEKRHLAIEEYATHILNREAGRVHDKKQ